MTPNPKPIQRYPKVFSVRQGLECCANQFMLTPMGQALAMGAWDMWPTNGHVIYVKFAISSFLTSPAEVEIP